MSDLDGLSDEFRAGVSKQLLGLSVDQGDFSVVVDDHHGVGRSLQQRTEFVFGFFSHSYISNCARHQYAHQTF